MQRHHFLERICQALIHERGDGSDGASQNYTMAMGVTANSAVPSHHVMGAPARRAYWVT
jgi:hypothetical protein